MKSIDQRLRAIISDEQVTRVHAHANFGTLTPREAVNEGVRKYAVGYTVGFTLFSILREHGLIKKPTRPDSDKSKLTAKGMAYGRVLYDMDHS